MISSIACSPPESAPFTSPLSNEANGSFVFHSGCWGASAFTRSSAKKSWKYIGCSHQSVPSLSKVAMRSLGGTKSDEPSFVTFSTNAMMAFFGAVSFHEGSESWAWMVLRPTKATPRRANALMMGFIGLISLVGSLVKDAGRLTRRSRAFHDRKARLIHRFGGRPMRAARREGHFCYWPVPLAAFSAWAIFAAISAFTASRLKLAPRCIGGYSRKVWSSLPITCCTKTKRQNWNLNQSKYCCAPSFVPMLGHPWRSNGSRRRLIRYGTSTWVFSPSQPWGWSMKRYL